MSRLLLTRPFVGRPIAVALLAACNSGDGGLTINNEEPVARITSHQDGDVVLEGRQVELVGAVSDEDDATADLVVSWQVNGVDLCAPAAPEGEGVTRCIATFPPGETTVSLVVRDVDDAVGIARVDLSVTPTGAPEVLIASPLSTDTTLYANLPVAVDGRVNDQEDAVDALVVAWTSDRDGVLPVPSPDTNGDTRGEVSLTAGDHLLTLSATDTDGKEGKAVVRVTVKPDNRPPDCRITMPTEDGSSERGQEVRFAASTTDPDVVSDLLTVAWASDRDGELSRGPATSAGTSEVRAGALSDGTHRITLTVTDEVGATCTDDVLWTVGLPPRITVLQPTDGAVRNLDDVVPFEATVTDPDHAPSELVMVWTSDLDGAFATLVPDSSGAAGTTYADLRRGTHNLTVRATDPDGLYHEVRRTLRINGVPAAPVVSLKPDPATTLDELAVSIDTAAVDPDGDPVSYTYRWSRDGLPSSASSTDKLPGTATKKGEVWSVDVTPTDGWGDGPSATASLLIQNSPPTLSSAMLSPSSPKTADDILCTPSGAADPDGDAVTVRYSWTIDGRTSPTTAATLPASETRKGDRVVCTATPFDGEDTGTAVVTPSVFVQNTAPSLASAAISPSSATTTTALTCTGSGYLDVDGDTDASTFSWKVGSSVVGSASTLSSGYKKGDTVTCEITPFDGTDKGTVVSASIVIKNAAPSVRSAFITPTSPDTTDGLTCGWSGYADADSDADKSTVQWIIGGKSVGTGTTLAAGVAKKGETVTCEVTPFDGTDKGTPVSASEKLVNAAPSISSVSVTPSSPTVDDDLECAWTGYSDPDGDPDKSTVTWKRGSTVLGSGTKLTSGYKKGETITCEVTPDDGTDKGVALTRSVTIQNSKPVLASTSLSPTTAFTDDTLTAAATTTDADGDTVTLKYAWKVKGSSVGVTTATLDGKTWFAKGDFVEVEITPNDGTDDGFSTVRSITISNSLPTLTGVSLSPSSPTVQSTLTCAGVGYADADGDPNNTRYSWHVGRSSNPAVGSGASFALSGRKKGDVMVCVATPNDGTSDGTPRETSVTIINAAPTVTAVSIAPSSPSKANTLSAVVTATDPDADTLTYTYAWTVNGASVSATGSTLAPSFFRRTDKVDVSVTANDGSLSSASFTSATVTIVNAKPTIGTVAIDIARPTIQDTVTCSYTGYSDLDGDKDASTFAWKQGSTVLATTASLSLSKQKKGDVINCEVTPNDGIDAGTPVVATVTIQNAAPVMVSATTSPAKLYTSGEAKASGSATDPDGDTVTLEYAWYVNSTKVAETSEYLDGVVYFKRGESVYVEITPFDGTIRGKAMKSTAVTVINTPPSSGGVIMYGTPRVGETLTCEVGGFTDDDGDPDMTTFTWTINGTSAGTGSSLRGGFKKGDKIECTATPYDGYDFGTPASVSTTGLNTKPTLTSVTLAPSTIFTDTDASLGSFTATDPDGDTITATGYAWTVNSASTGVTASKLPESYFKKGDRIVLNLTVSDGTATDSALSSAVTVANRPPTDPVVVFTPSVWFNGVTDLTTRKIVCSSSPTVTDIDGDTVTLKHTWKINGRAPSIPPIKADELDSFSFGDEDEIECSITASDGTATSFGTEFMDIFDDPADWVGHWGPCSATSKGGGSLTVEAWIYDSKRTPARGAATDMLVQAGVGPRGSDPVKEPGKWTWTTATWFAERPGLSTSTDNDSYKATITAPSTAGSYDVLWRVTTDSGLYYTYGDLYEETNKTYANGCKGSGSSDGYTNPMPLTVSP